MEIKENAIPLRVVRIDAHCRVCGAKLEKTTTLPNGFALNDKGEWARISDHNYLYTCPQCGEQTTTDTLYPHIEYRDIEEDIGE